MRFGFPCLFVAALFSPSAALAAGGSSARSICARVMTLVPLMDAAPAGSPVPAGESRFAQVIASHRPRKGGFRAAARALMAARRDIAISQRAALSEQVESAQAARDVVEREHGLYSDEWSAADLSVDSHKLAQLSNERLIAALDAPRPDTLVSSDRLGKGSRTIVTADGWPGLYPRLHATYRRRSREAPVLFFTRYYSHPLSLTEEPGGNDRGHNGVRHAAIFTVSRQSDDAFAIDHAPGDPHLVERYADQLWDEALESSGADSLAKIAELEFVFIGGNLSERAAGPIGDGLGLMLQIEKGLPLRSFSRILEHDVWAANSLETYVEQRLREAALAP